MRKVILLSIFTVISLSVHPQKLKTFYINAKGEKSSKLNAKFKRTVQNQNDMWFVQDYYLNDSLRMIGNFLDKNLTQKSGTFKHYRINGKMMRTNDWKDGLKHGNQKNYYFTGNISRSSHYNMGEVTGKWVWYNEDGSIENEIDNVNPNVLSENYDQAKYPGGKRKLNEFINRMDYRLNKGTVAVYDKTFTTFQIDEEGNVADIDIIVHGTEEMDSTIIEHLYNMPKWIAAKENGKFVSAYFLLPIKFTNKSEKVLSDKVLAEGLFSSSVNDYNEGDFEKAAFKLRRAISRNHMEAKYYYLLGNCYYQLNKQDVACEDWAVANSLDDKILKKEIKDLCHLE
jgi:antitoxin component YwqK of YwqJK toxin-antitoxin module